MDHWPKILCVSGVVMLTIMVCCFLVFGVQKGDENVLNATRRGYVQYIIRQSPLVAKCYLPSYLVS